MSLTKAKCQKIHFKRRLEERMGIKYTQKVNDDLIHKIRIGQIDVVKRQSRRTSIYRINYEQKDLFIVYDHIRGTLVTVLPPDNLEAED